jgi:hypothetical protein
MVRLHGQISMTYCDLKGVLDPACQQDFGLHWIAAFKMTPAFEVWDRVTDPMLFDLVEPKWVELPICDSSFAWG